MCLRRPSNNVDDLTTINLNPVMILTFDLQNLTRSSAWASASEYSLSVLSKLFMRYRDNNI